MTIGEALYKLKNTPVDVVVGDALEFALAKRLGIEALECVRYAQEIIGKTPTMTWAITELGLDKLPSETEEAIK